MTSIQMPQLGETIIEGTILKWLKQEGDTIERDEPLFEISTDKVDTEVPSPVAGTVTKILVPEGETVAVGTELAEIDSGDGAAAAPATPAADTGDSAEDPAAEVSAISTAEPVPTPQAARPAAQAPAVITTYPMHTTKRAESTKPLKRRSRRSKYSLITESRVTISVTSTLPREDSIWPKVIFRKRCGSIRITRKPIAILGS